MSKRTVIFTDLDGALLDGRSYSWRAAEEALAELDRRDVPLVFCTSKTRVEVEELRRKLDNGHPFITENGGGIFIPDGYFPSAMERASRVGRYHCIALGRPYREIVEQLERISAEAGAPVVGFHQMSAREIAANTGLDLHHAALAREREFDEPFFFAGATPAAENGFFELVREAGLIVARGDRFFHLFAGSDKGRAIRELSKLYRKAARDHIQIVAVGSSANDLPMLASADVAVLIPFARGQYDSEILARLPMAHLAARSGPSGWNESVLRVLRA